MLLYLIRHAESQNNARPPYNRVEDPALTAVGRLQAQYLAQWSEGLKFDMLVTSPVLRALQTARAIHEGTGQHVHVWDNVFEVGGVFRGFGPDAKQGGAGLNRRQVHQQAAGDVAFSTLDHSIGEAGWWGRPRESETEAWQRAAMVKKRLVACASKQVEALVVVTHAEFKRKLLLTLLPEVLQPEQINRLSNTGVTKLEWDALVWRLDYLDEVAHLPARLVTGITV